MKRLILTLLTAVFAMMIVAQPQVRKELKNNVALSASNSRAYPIPT